MDDSEDMENLEKYIEMGAVEVEGMDENGELIFSISEKAKEIAPELWASHQEYVDSHLIALYEKGLLSVEYNENLEAIMTLTPEGYKIARESGLIEIDVKKDIPNN